MPLELGGLAGLWRGEGTCVASDDVDPTGDTPRSAIVTPRPSLSDRPMFGRSPKLVAVRRRELSDAGYAARTGYTPATSGARSSSAIPRASNAAEKPLTALV